MTIFSVTKKHYEVGTFIDDNTIGYFHHGFFFRLQNLDGSIEKNLY